MRDSLDEWGLVKPVVQALQAMRGVPWVAAMNRLLQTRTVGGVATGS
jgi:hypothetical protein